MAHPWFRVGAKVEVISSVPCLSSNYLAATLIAPSFDSDDKYLVEYETLVIEEDDGESRPFQEDVNVGLIRPRPPPDTRTGFRSHDRVDALFHGSWWQGVVTKVLHNSRYMVHLECVDQSYQFQVSELRIHRDWIDGAWVPTFEAEQKEVKKEQVEIDLEEAIDYQIKAETNKNKTLQNLFGRGTLVEVMIDEDGLHGAWYAATIVNQVGGTSNKFFVEYLDLRSDINEEYLKEEVDVHHLRPYPLKETVIDGYSKHDYVDALYNDGWWEGKIRTVLGGCMYLVYFHGTKDELVFHQSELRPHRDWIDGNWVTSSSIARKAPQKMQKSSKKRRHSTA